MRLSQDGMRSALLHLLFRIFARSACRTQALIVSSCKYHVCHRLGSLVTATLHYSCRDLIDPLEVTAHDYPHGKAIDHSA